MTYASFWKWVIRVIITGVILCGIIFIAGIGILVYGLFAPEKTWWPLEKKYYAYEANCWLQNVATQQQLYYQQHGYYAKQWKQLAIPNLCPNNESDRCEKRDFLFSFLGYGFLLELQEDGVEASSHFYNYSLFQTYKSKDKQVGLRCLPRDKGAREVVCPELLQILSSKSCPLIRKSITPKNKNSAQEYEASGLAKYKREDYKGAIADYTRAIELSPNYALLYNRRAGAKVELGDYAGAEKDINRAIKLEPNGGGHWFARALLKNEMKRPEEALVDINKAIELEPEADAEVYLNRGFIKEDLQDCKGAIKDFTRAIELNPTEVLAYTRRGLCHGVVGEYKAAIADWTRVLELDSSSGFAYYMRGSLYLGRKNYPAAVADYTKAIELSSGENRAQAYQLRARAKRASGDIKGAKADEQKAKELSPNK